MTGPAAGYSGTPLPQKLGIKQGSRVLLLAPPGGFALSGLPDAVTVHRRRGQHHDEGSYDVALLFCPDARTLQRGFAPLIPALATAGALWVCWPKRAGGVATDLTEELVRRHGLECGLVDVKIAAVDATWSGLKFVRRRADRS
jgi:hypothetical protein